MSWERRVVCSTKHGPKSINLRWKFIVTLQRNLILPFAAWQNPFRGAGVILRDVQLDLTTATDLFDWWKWRGKCSGGGWRREAKAWEGLDRFKNPRLRISVTQRRKKAHKGKQKQTNMLTSGWIALKTGASMSVIWPWKGSKTTDVRRKYSHTVFCPFWGILHFKCCYFYAFLGSCKHCRPFLNCLVYYLDISNLKNNVPFSSP